MCRNHILIAQSDYVNHNPDDLIGMVCFTCQKAAEFDVRVETRLCVSSLYGTIITHGTVYSKTQNVSEIGGHIKILHCGQRQRQNFVQMCSRLRGFLVVTALVMHT